ncbi:MAG: glycosyltransferase family 4 protein [Acidobacteriota bacterium]
MPNAPREKLRLTFIISIEVRWLHLEWMCRELDREQFDISVLLVSLGGRTPHLKQFLIDHDIPFQHLHCTLAPLSLLRTVYAIYRYCRKERVDVVHTHMFLASLVGLLGSRLAGTPVRVNTRHHHLKHRSRSIIWLDRLANRLATHIVIASQLVHERLLQEQRTVSHKLARVRFGIDLDAFRGIEPERVAALRKKYSLSGQAPVIGVIARYLKSKGIQYVIPAFRELLEQYPSARLLLAYARGPDRRFIQEALAELPSESYLEIEFEDDVFALYQLFDVCVHVPTGVDLETFGLIYVEALAAGIPTVFTLSGVGPEFLTHRHNTWLVEHRNSAQIHQGLETVLASRELRERLVHNGSRSVEALFDLQQMVHALADLYHEWARLAAIPYSQRQTAHSIKGTVTNARGPSSS